jgi:hypothetical protein
MAPNERRPARGRATTGGARSGKTLTIVGVIVLAILAVTGIAALLNGGNDDGAPAASTSTPSASQNTAPTESPSPDATTSGPLATTPPGTKSVVHTYKGNGTKVVRITKPGQATDAVLVTATYRGGKNFSVFALDPSLHRGDILVNVVGQYQGTNLLDSQGTQTRALKVQAHGPWTIKIRPAAAARRVGANAKGTGDDVLLYTGTSGVAAFDYRGTLNFVVTYGDASNTGLVDAVGRFRGQVPIKSGPALIVISANGKWRMNVSP